MAVISVVVVAVVAVVAGWLAFGLDKRNSIWLINSGFRQMASAEPSGEGRWEVGGGEVKGGEGRPLPPLNHVMGFIFGIWNDEFDPFLWMAISKSDGVGFQRPRIWVNGGESLEASPPPGGE